MRILIGIGIGLGAALLGKPLWDKLNSGKAPVFPTPPGTNTLPDLPDTTPVKSDQQLAKEDIILKLKEKYGDPNSRNYNKYFAENITDEELLKLDEIKLQNLLTFDASNIFKKFTLKKQLKDINVIA